MFVYDHSSRRGTTESNPTVPQRVPMVSCALGTGGERGIVAFCRANKLGLNALLSAVVILTAEWRVRGTPTIPVPYVYPVDLRYLLAAGVGHRSHQPGRDRHLPGGDPRDTDIVDLARDINDTFKKDIADGVIQQSFLHFSPQYVGNPPDCPTS